MTAAAILVTAYYGDACFNTTAGTTLRSRPFFFATYDVRQLRYYVAGVLSRTFYDNSRIMLQAYDCVQYDSLISRAVRFTITAVRLPYLVTRQGYLLDERFRSLNMLYRYENRLSVEPM